MSKDRLSKASDVTPMIAQRELLAMTSGETSVAGSAIKPWPSQAVILGETPLSASQQTVRALAP